MTPFLIYLMQANAVLAVGCLLYLALGRDTFFQVRRFLLLAWGAFALAYPFLSEALSFFGETEQTIVIVLPIEVVVTPLNTTSESLLSWSQVLPIIYGVGVVVFAGRFLMAWFSLFRLARRCPRLESDGFVYYELPPGMGSFSFLRRTYISASDAASPRFASVCLHEAVHVRQWHTLDVIWMQALSLCCWFNPFVWLMTRELRRLHEYLADRGAVSRSLPRRAYQYAPLPPSQHSAAAYLNNFNVSYLKQSFKMMNRHPSHKMWQVKYLFFAPLVAIAFGVNVSARGIGHAETAGAENAQPSDTPHVKGYVTPTVGDRRVKLEDVKVEQVASHAVKTPRNPEIAQKKGVDVTQNSEQMTQITAHVMKNLRYPEGAMKSGEEDVCVVAFTLKADGTLGDFVVKKSQNRLCADEAVRVLKTMPKLKPFSVNGKPVDTKMSLPIRFRMQ